MENQKLNECYDSECDKRVCLNPEHYNYICMDPECDNVHCVNHKHYNKQLLKDYQEKTDFTVYESKKINYDADVDINICNCGDCSDTEEVGTHNHHHDSHDDCCCDDEHDHHDHHDSHDDCCCDDEHDHHDHHDHHDSHDDCCCDDEHDHHDSHDDCCCDDIKICNCDDCNDEDDNDEVIKEGIPLLKNRAIQIITSSAILFALGLIFEHLNITFGMIFNSPEFISIASIPVSSLFFVIVAIISGYDIAVMAKKALFRRYEITPAVLMVIAAIASFLIGHPEEGAAVTFLYFLAEFLEDYAELRAKHSIKSLVEIAPETAIVKAGSETKELSVNKVHIDDIVVVKPGDKIPLDGVVIEGVSSVNQASITGESVPVVKTVDDEVFSGTVNEDGYLEVRVTKEAKDSVISKIVTLVKTSQLNRSRTETLVEKIAKYYTPMMIVIIIIIAIVPPLFFGEDMFVWIERALQLMVISCPCAFLISTPIGMVSAITSATRKGVVIKGSSYVEEMRNIKTIIFDKTGTLTEGKLELVDIKIFNDEYSSNDVIELAASLEALSSHPIGQAIINYADENNIKYSQVENFKNVPGKGIIGVIDGEEYYAANESLIEGDNFNISHNEVVSYASDGKTVIFVGNKDEVIGLITVTDKIRDETVDVIRNLKDQGINTVMLTGDNKVAAQAVANQIGIDYAYSNLLPEDKINILDTIRNKFGDVAMVGDGVNDAPALARANVGIAMGAVGSDVAIETADVALMQDDLTKLPYLFTLSNKTMSIIKQNIVTSLGVKFLFVILAILGFITLIMAVGIGDLGLTLLVIVNSFRIGIVKDPIF